VFSASRCVLDLDLDPGLSTHTLDLDLGLELAAHTRRWARLQPYAADRLSGLYLWFQHAAARLMPDRAGTDAWRTAGHEPSS